MANFSVKNVQLTAAKIYIAAFDPESTIASNMPANTLVSENDNIDAVIGYIEANYSFQRMAGFKNVLISDALENDVVNEVDDCDIREWSKFTDIVPTLTGDWLTTLDLSAIKILLGFEVVATPGTSVTGAVQNIVGATYSFDTIYRLGLQHHDATGQIIAPAVLVVVADPLNTAVTLTDTVDYDIVDNGFGEFGIVLKLGTNLPTNVKDIEITYDYTPIAAEYTGYLIGQTIQPYMIVKVVGCEDKDGMFDTWYIVKASLSGSLDTNFIATGEVPLSSITLVGGKGGRKLLKRNRI